MFRGGRGLLTLWSGTNYTRRGMVDDGGLEVAAVQRRTAAPATPAS